jgi:hypothetical protein
MAVITAHNLAIAAAGLSVVLLVRLLVALVVNYNQLKQFRGPRLAGLSRFWLFKEEVAGRLPHSQTDALKKYGELRYTHCSTCHLPHILMFGMIFQAHHVESDQTSSSPTTPTSSAI